jgi:hypothetical protein
VRRENGAAIHYASSPARQLSFVSTARPSACCPIQRATLSHHLLAPEDRRGRSGATARQLWLICNRLQEDLTQNVAMQQISLHAAPAKRMLEPADALRRPAFLDVSSLNFGGATSTAVFVACPSWSSAYPATERRRISAPGLSNVVRWARENEGTRPNAAIFMNLVRPGDRGFIRSTGLGAAGPLYIPPTRLRPGRRRPVPDFEEPLPGSRLTSI